MNSLKQIIEDNSDLIPGIYNFCDRWCEKCKKTDKCTIYKFENSKDIDNENIDDISDILKQAIDILKDIAEQENIDFNVDEIFNDIENNKEDDDFQNSNSEIENNILCILAKKYVDLTSILLDNVNEKLELIHNNMLVKQELDIEIEELDIKFDDIDYAFDVIINYHHLIYIKLFRAIDNLFFNEEYKNDSNGYAKLVLIIINKSFNAWKLVMEFIPNIQDEIIDVLALLQKLERETNNTFPEAKKFVRIGFEDED